MEMSSYLLGSTRDFVQNVETGESDFATELRNPIHHHSRWACFEVEQFVFSPWFPLFFNLLNLVGLRDDDKYEALSYLSCAWRRRLVVIICACSLPYWVYFTIIFHPPSLTLSILMTTLFSVPFLMFLFGSSYLLPSKKVSLYDNVWHYRNFRHTTSETGSQKLDTVQDLAMMLAMNVQRRKDAELDWRGVLAVVVVLPSLILISVMYEMIATPGFVYDSHYFIYYTLHNMGVSFLFMYFAAKVSDDTYVYRNEVNKRVSHGAIILVTSNQLIAYSRLHEPLDWLNRDFVETLDSSGTWYSGKSHHHQPSAFAPVVASAYERDVLFWQHDGDSERHERWFHNESTYYLLNGLCFTIPLFTYHTIWLFHGVLQSTNQMSYVILPFLLVIAFVRVHIPLLLLVTFAMQARTEVLKVAVFLRQHPTCQRVVDTRKCALDLPNETLEVTSQSISYMRYISDCYSGFSIIGIPMNRELLVKYVSLLVSVLAAVLNYSLKNTAPVISA